jgi:hypothetical protein
LVGKRVAEVESQNTRTRVLAILRPNGQTAELSEPIDAGQWLVVHTTTDHLLALAQEGQKP